MNTLEKFHIYLEIEKNNQINDECTVKPNHLFDTVTQNKPHR